VTHEGFDVTIDRILRERGIREGHVGKILGTGSSTQIMSQKVLCCTLSAHNFDYKQNEN